VRRVVLVADGVFGLQVIEQLAAARELGFEFVGDAGLVLRNLAERGKLRRRGGPYRPSAKRSLPTLTA